MTKRLTVYIVFRPLENVSIRHWRTSAKVISSPDH